MPECMAFQLHSKLALGCLPIDRICGCRVLLKDNSIFPWFLVVPEVEDGIEDLHQLDDARYHEVLTLVRGVSQFVESQFRTEKLNVASIGNQVRQMHVHIVGRNSSDPAWPGVVWGYSEKRPYTEEDVQRIRSAWNLHAERFRNRICRAESY